MCFYFTNFLCQNSRSHIYYFVVVIYPQDAAPASAKREASPPAPKPAPVVDDDGFTMIPKTTKDTPKKKKSKAKAEPVSCGLWGCSICTVILLWKHLQIKVN